jgi:hypothetical protein
MGTFKAIRIEKSEAGYQAAFADFDDADLMDGDVTVRVTHSTVTYKDGLAVTTPPVAIKAGPHKVAATFVREFEGSEDDLMKPIDHTLADTQIGVGYGVTTLAHLRNLAIIGPTAVTGVSDNNVRRHVFSCRPSSSLTPAACAKQILERLATEAYRRPVTATDVSQLMPLFEKGAAKGDFDAGIRTALQGVLSSLHFIFRVEETPAGVKAGDVYKINDVDLDDRGLAYASDRTGAGLFILKYTGAARGQGL